MTDLVAVLSVAGVVVLVAESSRARGDRPLQTRRSSRRFGSLATAWALRARSGFLPLGRWATSGWHATPIRLGAHAPGSVLVVGPTQSGKTTRLCAPLVEGWDGPVLAASVKGDLARMTAAARERRGTVSIVAPGVPGSATWDPVPMARTLPLARALARDLTIGTGAGAGAADQEFWAALSSKLLAPMLLGANLAGGNIATVKGWVDRRELDEPIAHLADDTDAIDALVASFSRDERTLGSVLATVEAAVDALEPAARSIDPAELLSGPNTCYLAAPLHDQRRFRPTSSGLLRGVLAAAATRAESGSRCSLLVLLDEAASIAPIEELDQVAATCQGQGVTLVTVWQDLAQLSARYGPRARTLVNNHSARVLLGGLADPTLAEWLPTLTGPGDPSRAEGPGPHVTPEELRQWPQGAALLIVGRHRPVRLALRPPRRAAAGVAVDPTRYASARGVLRPLRSSVGRGSNAAVRRAP